MHGNTGASSGISVQTATIMRVKLSFPFLEFHYVNRISKFLVADFSIGFHNTLLTKPADHCAPPDFRVH
ncbi:MAG: hypothetical protein ACLQO6_19565 [Desulfomonilaceae bacterium]